VQTVPTALAAPLDGIYAARATPNPDRIPTTKETIMADTKHKSAPKPASPPAKSQTGGKKDRKDELSIDDLSKVSGGRMKQKVT
jgi:hypothetical protein